MTIDLGEVRAAAPAGLVIHAFIKQGGQGAVFRGEVNGVQAAIKLFSPSVETRRIDREIVALTSNSCPSLVKVLHHTTVQIRGCDLPLVAYEFHDGGDLDALVRAAPSSVPRLGTVARIGHDVAVAVDFLWQMRIVHRDIKPGNIVARARDGFVLVDIGFARHVDRSDITAPGLVAGTEGYKSPEQQAGRRLLTVNSDIFSLGVTLYQIASGKHPFNGYQHLIGRVTPAPLRQLRPEFPSSLCTAIERMMANSPPDRPKVADLIQLLQGL